jgi:hypothetical protein
MVERHITIEVIGAGVDVSETIRVLSELWYRAVYWSPPDSGAVLEPAADDVSATDGTLGTSPG